MTVDVPPILEVVGGSHGMSVAYDHALALAETYDLAGDRLRAWSGETSRVLLDGDLLASAPLSPVTFAAAEAAVLAADVGPDGLLAASVAWETDAMTIRLAVRALRATDGLAGHAFGHLLGAVVPEAVLGLAVDGTGLRAPDVESAAGLLARSYHDGDQLTEPTHLRVPDSTTVPADLAAMVEHLAQVNALSTLEHPERNGTIEVQTITASDGSVRHVVYLPGTDDLTTMPWTQDGDVRDADTNLLLLGGHDNAYQRGIVDAMGQAGIGPGEPVALVGHSQGGMAAAAILSQGSPYDVTTVVTVGAPTAQVPGFPVGSHVLSLENAGDVVPLLDGADNRDSAEQATVRFDDDSGPPSRHALGHYVAGAMAVRASDDPSLHDELTSLRAQGFVGSAEGSRVTSQVFQITRVQR